MIRIRIQSGKINEPCGLEVSGHAGLAESGSDILCAAVSALSENLGTSLEELLGIRNAIVKDGGYFRLSLSSEQHTKEADLLVSSTVLGLGKLKAMYPERIEVVLE